jgi:hypothetical protein
MIVFHGTTARRARRICEEGFLPKKPSRRVWFAESRRYALGRAKTQARRSRDRPVVLACDIDLHHLRARYGSKRVLHRSRVIAIDGSVPVSVLRSRPFAGVPTTPEAIARWVNHLLGLKPHKGAGKRQRGVIRLSEWVNKRLATAPRRGVTPRQLLRMAQRWLPELFEGFEIDPDSLRAFRVAGDVHVQVDEEAVEPDPREEEALECLEAPKAETRARGLELLAKIGDPDLFDWCAMFLDDPALTVRLAALRLMRGCEDGSPEGIEPLAKSPNKRLRGAALAALAHLGGPDRPRWLKRGLKDPAPCVRVAVARELEHLDATEHQEVFELALYDPNPDVARAARKLAAHKGYAKTRW